MTVKKIETKVVSRRPSVRVFLLNGPPRSGKDSVCDAVLSQTDFKIKFATPIKNSMATFFSLSQGQFSLLDNELKDVPQDKFFGKTWREACIGFSESFCKPLFGPDVFGKMAVEKIKEVKRTPQHAHVNTCFIADCGFAEEVTPLIEEFGAENIFLIHVMRDGCNFSNDSRSYIDGEALGIAAITIKNNSLEQFAEDFSKIIALAKAGNIKVAAKKEVALVVELPEDSTLSLPSKKKPKKTTLGTKKKKVKKVKEKALVELEQPVS